MDNKKNCIVYLSTYPPRKCGIAAFTQDLANAANTVSQLKAKIVALNTNGNSYNYSDEVLYQINDKDAEDYLQLARKINENNEIKLVHVQHEFKIFGSDYGENLLLFLEAVQKPVITTFHTVLPCPSKQRKEIVQLIAYHSEYVVVMAQSAVRILKEDYKIKDSKIMVIPHGIHDLPYEQNTYSKEGLGYKDKLLLTSFGLLRPGRARNSSGKGHEYVLDALPDIIKKFPNVLYLIIGVTHPKYLKAEGERYREFLKSKVIELGIENNVKFINKYVALDELFQYLKASDVYICSSLNENQITSGTLVYAMGCGRAVVSTPFIHAKDIITHERGILTEFKNSKSFFDAVIKILSHPELKETMEKNNYAYTRHMTWPKVALSYLNLFNKHIAIKKAIILAGGLGTRLRHLTLTTPKPLLLIKGKPIIEHAINNFKKHGIKDIILSIGYKADKIREYFGNGEKLGVNISYCVEDEPLGTGGAIKKAAENINETFIAINGDNLADFNWTEIVQAHKKNKAEITLGLFPVEDVTKFGIARLEGEKLIEFIEKPSVEEAPSNLNNAGAYVMEPDALNILPQGKSSIERDCFEKLASKGEITAYIHKGQWFPTDTIEKYTKAKKEFKQQNVINIQSL